MKGYPWDLTENVINKQNTSKRKQANYLDV